MLSHSSTPERLFAQYCRCMPSEAAPGSPPATSEYALVPNSYTRAVAMNAGAPRSTASATNTRGSVAALNFGPSHPASPAAPRSSEPAASSDKNGMEGNQCFTPPKCGTLGWLMRAMDITALAATMNSNPVSWRFTARHDTQANPSTMGTNSETGTVSAVLLITYIHGNGGARSSSPK